MNWSEPRWLLLAAAALAMLPAAWAASRWRRRQQERVASRALWLRWLGGVPATGGLRLTLWLLAAAAAGTAAAGPRWGRPRQQPSRDLDVVVALDVSDSMSCTDVVPDRLARAVAVLRQTVDRFPGAAWGLTIGAGTARPLVPLTFDAATLRARLADPDLRQWVAPGSNLANLLATAGALLPGAGPGRAIVLATDGEELDGEAARVAEGLRRAGVAVVPLLSGTVAGAPVPRADANGNVTYVRDAAGRLVRSRAHPELLGRLAGAPTPVVDAGSPGASRLLAGALERAVRVAQRETAPLRSAGFALAAALLATGAFLLAPWRRAALLVIVLPAAMASAEPPAAPAAWERVVPGRAALLAREARRAAARGDWEDAARTYARASSLRPADLALRLALATAEARLLEPAGDAGLETLARVPALAGTAWFNLGTARLLRGDPSAAAAALRRAVLADPDRGDAWHNLELALAAERRERAGTIPPTAGERRERLVEEAARATLQPLRVRAAAPEQSPSGRDW